MKIEFLKKEGCTALEIIFAGWGMDIHPFVDEYSDSRDICVCYDFEDLSFDNSFIKGYNQIFLTAWSLGVWAAACTFEKSSIVFAKKVAINGTLKPIHDKEGIPFSTFEATLNNLSESSMIKFQRRMCKSKQLYTIFSSKKPIRSLDSLKTELVSISENAKKREIPSFEWDLAVIGQNDLIFPYENQKEAWTGNTLILETTDAHYPSHFLNYDIPTNR